MHTRRAYHGTTQCEEYIDQGRLEVMTEWDAAMSRKVALVRCRSKKVSRKRHQGKEERWSCAVCPTLHVPARLDAWKQLQMTISEETQRRDGSGPAIIVHCARLTLRW